MYSYWDINNIQELFSSSIILIIKEYSIHKVSDNIHTRCLIIYIHTQPDNIHTLPIVYWYPPGRWLKMAESKILPTLKITYEYDERWDEELKRIVNFALLETPKNPLIIG